MIMTATTTKDKIVFQIRREINERTADARVENMVKSIQDEVLQNVPHKLKADYETYVPIEGETHRYAFYADIIFSPKLPGGWDEKTYVKVHNSLLEALGKAGTHTRYNLYPWEIVSINEEETVDPLPDDDDDEGSRGTGKKITWEEFEEHPKYHDMLAYIDMDNKQLGRSEAFSGIYEREAHIRIILGAIQRAVETGGRVRNHVLLWGDPGAAKSGLIEALKEVLPEDCWEGFNMDSTTKAGLQAFFLKRAQERGGIPPIVFLEEVEKVPNEGILSPLLSMLDTRAMIQKITNRDDEQKSARVLFIATANDKYAFDSMMGGRRLPNGGFQPGALSSRFVNQLEVHRPSPSAMRKILHRELIANPINLPDGFTDEDIIDKVMELSSDLNVGDPRRVISFLDGGLRLLDDSYQKDIKEVQQISN